MASLFAVAKFAPAFQQTGFEKQIICVLKALLCPAWQNFVASHYLYADRESLAPSAANMQVFASEHRADAFR